MSDFGMSSFNNAINQASNSYNDGVLDHNELLDQHLNTALDTIKNSKEGKIAEVLVHTGDAGKEAFYSSELSEAVKNYKRYKTQYKVDDVGHITANKNYLSDKFKKFRTGDKNNDDVDKDSTGTQVERDTGATPPSDDPVGARVSGRISRTTSAESTGVEADAGEDEGAGESLESAVKSGKTTLFKSSEGTDALAQRVRQFGVREDPRFRLSMSDDAIDTAGENTGLTGTFKGVSLQRQLAVREPARPRSPDPEPEPEQIQDRNEDTGTENSGDTGARNEEPAPVKSTDTSSAPTTNEEIVPSSDDAPVKSIGGKLKTAISDKTGITEEGLDAGMYGAKKIIGGTMGVVSTISDISSGKLSGDNTAEKVGDVLGQVGAYTDLIGTAIPILEPLGALVGIAGGLAEGIGHIEDDVDEAKKIKDREQTAKDKTNALKDTAGASFQYNQMGLTSSMSKNPRLQISGTGAF